MTGTCRKEKEKMEEIFKRLNELIEQNKWNEIGPFLRGTMEEAREAEEYGIYIAVGNELLSFYTQNDNFEGAFLLAEDLLLLMEEFHLEDTQHFALVLVNAASAYSEAKRYEDADTCYTRAAGILEKSQETQQRELLAEVLTNRALNLDKMDRQEDGRHFLEQAVSIFENEREESRPAVAADRREIYHITALSGLGEAAYREKDWEKALYYYSKAAELCRGSRKNSESEKIFRQNCAVIEAAMKKQ